MKLTAALAVLIVALDQIVKLEIVRTLRRAQTIPVMENFFNLTRVHNRGAAFGLFSHHPTLFIFLSLLTIALLLYFYRHLFRKGILFSVAVGLILGGALGNLIDRIFRGAVIDFLDFYLRWGGREHHWPAFNLADSSICVGVAVLLGMAIFPRREKKAA